MNILVLLKQTFDTEEKIVIQNGEISEDGVKFIINPYDEYAVEEAVRIKEEHGAEVESFLLRSVRIILLQMNRMKVGLPTLNI